MRAKIDRTPMTSRARMFLSGHLVPSRATRRETGEEWETMRGKRARWTRARVVTARTMRLTA